MKPMKQKSCLIHSLPGHEINNKRGIAYLTYHGDSFVDFAAELDAWNVLKLRKNVQRAFNHIFGKWIAGHNFEDAHKYNRDQKKGRDYPNACTFERHGFDSRIYCFRCHPDPSNPQFELRVLVHFAKKFTYKTDPRNLKRCQELHDDPSVRRAVEEWCQSD